MPLPNAEIQPPALMHGNAANGANGHALNRTWREPASRKGAAIARLRKDIAALERGGLPPRITQNASCHALGPDALDAALGGGLCRDALYDIRPGRPSVPGAALGFMLGALQRVLATHAGTAVYILEHNTLREYGLPYLPGIMALSAGDDGSLMQDIGARIIFVCVRNPHEALLAAEEALATPGLAVVCVETAGGSLEAPGAAGDLTRSRRLSLRARTQTTPVLLLHHGLAPRGRSGRMAREAWKDNPAENGESIPSTARARFLVEPAPSLRAFGTASFAKPPSSPSLSASAPPMPGGAGLDGLGPPALTLRLVRNRAGPTGIWQLAWNPIAKVFQYHHQAATPPLQDNHQSQPHWDVTSDVTIPDAAHPNITHRPAAA